MLPDAGVGRACASLQSRRVRLHDYCIPASRFAHAPANTTVWRRGVALLGNELHTDNFHHFNRDLLFFARMLHRGLVTAETVSHVVVTDHSELVSWAIEHARVVLGPQLVQRLVFLPRKRAPRSTGRAQLSNATLPRARYVCFDAAVEKLVTDPIDRDDVAWMRARAYDACGVPRAIPPSSPRLLLLLLRGDPSVHDKPTTARQMANGDEVRTALDAFARAHGLLLHATAFAGMTYCEQVRLASAARVLVGVHGQGFTNGQFMPDDGLVVELFHGGQRPFWSRFDNVGHQPLFLGAGRPYVAAPYADSPCSMMQWKHDVACKSHVNSTRLLALLTWAMRLEVEGAVSEEAVSTVGANVIGL